MMTSSLSPWYEFASHLLEDATLGTLSTFAEARVNISDPGFRPLLDLLHDHNPKAICFIST